MMNSMKMSGPVVMLLMMMVLLVASGARAQEVRVELGRVAVHVGMGQEEVARQIAENKYSLTSLPGESHAVAVWDQAELGSTSRLLGTLEIVDGKLKAIVKNWSPRDGDRAVDVGDALFAIASDFARTASTTCVLSGRSNKTSEQLEQITSLQCGRRLVEVSTLRNEVHGILRTIVTERVE